MQDKFKKFLGSNEPKIVLALASLLPLGVLTVLLWVIFFHFSIYGDMWRNRACYEDASCQSVIKNYGAQWGYQDRVQISRGTDGSGNYVSTFTYCPSIETQRSSSQQQNEERASVAMDLKERGLVSNAEPLIVTAKCRYTKGHPVIEALFGAPLEQIFGQTYYGAEKIPGKPEKRDFDILQIDPT